MRKREVRWERGSVKAKERKQKKSESELEKKESKK